MGGKLICSSILFGIICIAKISYALEEPLNLLAGDSGFETGQLANTFLFHQSFTETTNISIDKTQAFERKQSLKLEFCKQGDFVFGKYIQTIPGEIYTFSCYIKSFSDNERCKLGIVNRGNHSLQGKIITVSKEWRQYSFTFKAAYSEYSLVFFWLGDNGTGAIWADEIKFAALPDTKHILNVDALQLEKGEKANSYRPGSDISIGINIPSEYDGVFLAGEKIEIILSAIASDKASANLKEISFLWRISDFSGNIVTSGQEKIFQDGGGRFCKKISFMPDRLGLYVVRAMLDSEERYGQNPLVTFAVVKPPVKVDNELNRFCSVNNNSYPSLSRLGISMLQMPVRWSNVEKGKGKFDWTFTDKYFAYKKAGYVIKCMLIDSPPAWAIDPKEAEEASALKVGVPLPAKDKVEDFRKFIKEIASRYKNVVDIWEIGAESDGVVGENKYYKMKYPEYIEKGHVLGPVTDRVAELVKVAAEEISAANPDAMIGAIRAMDCLHYVFARDVFKKGIGKAINIFPLDCYHSPFVIGPENCASVPDDFLPDAIKDAQKITKEYGNGFPVYISEYGWGWDKRIEPDGIYALDMVKRISRTFLIARREGARYCSWFALGSYSYEFDGRFTYGMFHNGIIMPTLPAFCAVAQIVENVSESKEINLLGIKAVVFRKTDRQEADAALWLTNGESGEIKINNWNENISIWDVMGNPVPVISKNGIMTIKIDEFPKYLILKGKGSFEKLAEIITAGKIRRSPVKISLDTPKMDRSLVVLNNQSGQDINSTVIISIDGKEIKRESVNLSKISSDFRTEVPFIFPSDAISKLRELKVRVLTPDFEDSVKTFPLELKQVPRLKFHVEIDGDLAEWKDQPYTLLDKRENVRPTDHIDWKNPEDLSVKYYCAWDPWFLFMAFEVTEDRHINNQTGLNVWNSNCVKFAFAGTNEGKGYGEYDYEAGVALTSHGLESYQWYGEKKIWKNKETEWAARRDEANKKTTYEIKIPIRTLSIYYQIGTIFGFSFMAYKDNYWIELTPGLADITKEPELFKKFVLTE